MEIILVICSVNALISNNDEHPENICPKLLQFDTFHYKNGMYQMVIILEVCSDHVHHY